MSTEYMKVFFTGSTSNLKEDNDRYDYINNLIMSLGHESTNYIHHPKDSSYRNKVEKSLEDSGKNVYDFVIQLITSSDTIIADITTQSIKVGYQLDYALHNKIPALVLYKNSEDFVLPVMLNTSRYGLLQVKEYKNNEDIEVIIRNYLSNIISGKIKFNFYINHRIYNYLNRRAQQEGRNKSDIVRDLLLEEINENPLD
jgi:hypothetical protein